MTIEAGTSSGASIDTGDVKAAQATLPLTTALACVVFLAFVAGSLTMYGDAFPAGMLRRSFQGGIALYDQLTGYGDRYGTDFWKPARTDLRGVVRHDQARAHQGLTLYTSGHDQRAFLMDMDA